MKSNTKQFPKNKIAWLWENMEGKRALYFVGILGTVLYNILQLTIPYFSGKIVDLFLTGENAATNLQVHRDLLYRLLFAMVGFTSVSYTHLDVYKRQPVERKQLRPGRRTAW